MSFGCRFTEFHKTLQIHTLFFLDAKYFNDEAHRDSSTRIEATALLSFQPLDRRIIWSWGMSRDCDAHRLTLTKSLIACGAASPATFKPHLVH